MTKDQLEKLNKEYKELSTVFGNLSEKFKKTQGNMMGMEDNKLMYDLIENVHKRIDSLANDLYNHTYSSNIHLPPLTAGQLEKLLKNIGAENDYEIKKKIIYANLGRNPILEVSYSPPKTA